MSDNNEAVLLVILRMDDYLQVPSSKKHLCCSRTFLYIKKLKRWDNTKLFPNTSTIFNVLVVGLIPYCQGFDPVATGCCLSNHDEILKKLPTLFKQLKAGNPFRKINFCLFSHFASSKLTIK